MSKNAGKKEMKEANRLMRDNIARLEALNVPTITAQRIALESPELIGQLEAEILGRSRFEDIQMDPRLEAINRAALEGITGIAETGFGAADRLALEEVRRRSTGQAQAQIASQEQRLQEQGILDSGLGIILRGQAGQQAAEAERMSGMQQAAQAQQARMSALGQQGNMAAQMQGQQLGLAGQKASAADAIAQFNAQQRMGVQSQNLAARQGIANQGTATRNQQEMYNKALLQQQFQNQMAKATGVTGQQTQLANLYGQQATAAQQGEQAMTGALVGAAGTAAGAYFGGPAGAAAVKKVVG